MKEIKKIVVNKNRGWRGLAEVKAYDGKNNEVLSSIFSFSQDVWNDLMNGYIVLADNLDEKYYVCSIGNTGALPQEQQRSVLIKNFTADVHYANMYEMKGIGQAERYSNDGMKIERFKQNRNNHTTSDWNYIGIRVIPTL